MSLSADVPNNDPLAVEIAPYIRTLPVYEPGKPIEETERELGISGVTKLASNENPLGPSPLALAAIQKAAASLHLYPDGSGFHLKRRLAQHLAVKPEQIILGNGSNEILEFVLRATARVDGYIVMGWPSFVIYRIAAQCAGLRSRQVRMPDCQYDVNALLNAVDEKTTAVLIGHPSNPTGTFLKKRDLERVVNEVPKSVAVVIDEAYFEYVDDPEYVSGLQLLRSNVVVLRTFSKAYGLAGLRVGYGVGQPEFISYLNRVREPFNVNSLAQAGATAALDDRAHVEACVRENNSERKRITAAFEALGLRVVPSVANFILVDVGRPCREVFEALLRKGVITRPMNPYDLPQHLRLSFGTRSENDKLIAAMTEVLT